MRLRSLLVTAALGCAVTFGCLVPSIDLAGKDCPCIEGYLCVEGKCLPAGQVLPDAGGDAALTCTGTSRFCVGATWLACDGQKPILPTDCSATALRCDTARGCLSSCSGASCDPGRVCDRSTSLCVTVPACEGAVRCTEGTCLSGACLPSPTSPATVTLGPDASQQADLSCYPLAGADAGVLPDDDAGTIALSGYVQTPAGKVSPLTIGYSLRLWRAKDFTASEAATEVTSTVVFDAGFGDGGAAGRFLLQNVPSGADLVSLCEGPGAVPTYQYFRVPSGTTDVSITCYDRELWDKLAANTYPGPDAGLDPLRAGIAGQVYDCRPTPARMAGSVVRLSTPGRAWYTYAGFPGVLVVDPDEPSTTESGRFFFFDVPAMQLSVVAVESPGSARMQQQDIRTVPGSVTVVTLRPQGR